MRVADVERALRATGMRGGRLRGLRVLQRNASGRVVRLRAEGFTPTDISGTDFRMAIGRIGGWQLVKSTAFDVERTGSGYRFRGRGFGHGVGLCVIGAGRRAARAPRRTPSSASISRAWFVGTADRARHHGRAAGACRSARVPGRCPSAVPRHTSSDGDASSKSSHPPPAPEAPAAAPPVPRATDVLDRLAGCRRVRARHAPRSSDARGTRRKRPDVRSRRLCG